MSERKHIQEALFHRQLWSGPGRFPALKWCSQSGTLAVMTQTTVQIHSYQFEYMASFRASWLCVEKGGTSSGIAAYTPGEGSLSSLTDWLNRNSMKESVDVQSIAWSDHLREDICNHPLLTVLLTDGSLLLVDVVNGGRAVADSEASRTGTSFHPVTNGFQVRLHGLALALDCAAAWNAHVTAHGGSPGAADRIRCFAEHRIEGTEGTVLVLASRNKISLWRVEHSTHGTGGSELSIKHLGECIVTTVGGSDAITALVVCPKAGTSGSGGPGGDVRSFVVAASTGAGDVHLVRFAVISSAPQPGTVQVQEGAEVLTVKVCGSAIADLQLQRQGSEGGWWLCAVAGSAVHSLPLTQVLAFSTGSSAAVDAHREVTLTSTSQLHKSNVVSVVQLPAVHTGLEHAVRTVTATTTGDMASWAVAAPDHSCSRLTWSQLSTLPNRSAGYPILGLGSDGVGLMCAYLYKTPATHANTREVQLNNALRFPRAAVGWELSPFVAEDFAASARMVAEVMLYLVARTGDGEAHSPLCLTALPLAFLRSLECEAVRQHYRSQIRDLKVFPVLTPSSRHGSTASRGTPASGAGASAGAVAGTAEAGAVKVEGSAVMDISSSDSDDPEEGGNADGDFDSDQSDSRAGGSVINKGSAVKSNRFGTPAHQKTRVSNMNAVYERIEQMERPSKPEAVALSVPTLFDAAVMAVKCLAAADTGGSGAATSSVRRHADGRVLVDEDICDTVEERLDLDEKIAALFSLPSPDDPRLLEGKQVVWRCLHLLLLACHRVRGVPAFGAEWEPFPATLRQLLHTAHCIRALQRYTAQAAGSTSGTADASSVRLASQSAYFMSQVVLARVETSPDPAVTTALSQLVGAVHSRLSQAADTQGRSVADLYGSELCAICGGNVAFHPHDDDSSDAAIWEAAINGAVKVVRGGSVLHGSCGGCGLRVERCCFSLLLVTTSCAGDKSGSVDDTGSGDRLLGCPVCDAVTTPALARVGGAGTAVAVLCPFCGVLMLPR